MLCKKLMMWYGLSHECMTTPYKREACNSLWVVLPNGVGIQVCFNCLLYMTYSGLIEGSVTRVQEEEES